MRLAPLFLALAVPMVARADSGLPQPRPERCLAPPSEVEGDHDVVTALGLSEEDAAGALARALPAILPCLGDAAPAQALVLRFTVGCDGLVTAIETVARGDWSDAVVACVDATLKNADFPAHDQEAGTQFEYPIHVRR